MSAPLAILIESDALLTATKVSLMKFDKRSNSSLSHENFSCFAT